MRKLLYSLVPALVAAVAPAALADDWPRWLGPGYDGASRERGWLKAWPEGGPPRLWAKEIGTGYSGISVARGHLILYHRTGGTMRIESLEPSSGKERWSYAYPTDYEDAYGYDNGPRCAPEVYEDGVFALGPEGELHAVALESGKKLWSRELEKELELQPNFFGTGATPLIEAGVLYVNLGGTDLGSGKALAISTADGKTIWESRIEGGSYASPLLAEVAGARQLFIFHRGGLSALDPADGRERWMFRWHSRIYESVNGATPVMAGDLIFFSATYGTGGVCLRVKESYYEVVWKDDPSRREKVLDIHWATPNLVDGHVYGFAGRHEVESVLKCVELSSGKVKWSWEGYSQDLAPPSGAAGGGQPASRPSGLGRGAMIYSDGHFIALGERGDLVLLKLSPAGREEVARVRRILRYPAWTPPTLANGRLYLRDLKQLICLDLRAEPAAQ
jgi:outer membrane protein assembly factor BamB